MHIIGTAGHVDHGKSALVEALTGTHPDRFEEERLRGMTLDLGFAHLRFDDGSEAGIIDVPGHERFVHNLLAGAAGVELALLVVAANEGTMPQTFEHLQMLRYLDVRATVVAVTKADLLDARALDNAIATIRRELSGTIAADAPLVAVSSRTGVGLDALRAALSRALAALPSHDPQAPVYLPIDRAFVLPGRGTIVTGTLMQGRIRVGDELMVQPRGLPVRVRALQVFGRERDEAIGRTRLALNLPGVAKESIRRGDFVVDAHVEPRAVFGVRFNATADARALLRRTTPVRAHIGSGESIGTLRFETLPSANEPVRATLSLREPVVVFPGVRFVVRRVSPKTLLGGGEIERVDVDGAALDSDVDDPVQRVVLAVLEAEALEPMEVSAIAFAANVREAVAQRALDALLATGDVVRVQRPTAYLAAASVATFIRRVLDELETAHADQPWTIGATSMALARTLRVPEPLLVRLLGVAVDDGRVARRAGYYATPSHEARLMPAQRAFFLDAVAIDAEHPFLPVAFDGVVAAMKGASLPGLSQVLETLLVRGTLVRVGESLYHGSQIREIHARLEAFFAANERMTMADFRTLLGTSRKYAVPLLEWFDARAVTVRVGDDRLLRERETHATTGALKRVTSRKSSA